MTQLSPHLLASVHRIQQQYAAEQRRKEEEKNKPFPLLALLKLYNRQHRILYLAHFENFRVLAKALAPYEIPSWCEPKQVIQSLFTYEQQEIARILEVHPSIIQQLFIHLAIQSGELICQQ